MKKLVKNSALLSIAAIFLYCSMAEAASAYKQDTGIITSLYVTTSGAIAIKLNNGFPQSYGDGQCAGASLNGFGGNSSITDPLMKSVLLTAKAAQQSITVTVVGCDSGNTNWFKITDVYVN